MSPRSLLVACSSKSKMAICLTEETYGMERIGSGNQNVKKVLWLANSKRMDDLIGPFKVKAGLKNFFPVPSFILPFLIGKWNSKLSS